MTVRRAYIDLALASYASLKLVLDKLSEEEVLHCLELEAASRRRQSIVDRLIQRAVRINEQSYSTQLREKFNGTRPVQNHDHR